MNILHYESCKLMRESIRDSVESLGMSCFFAISMEEGAEILKTKKIGLIIIAIKIENFDCEALVVELSKSDYNLIPVLILTATENCAMREKLFHYGIVDFMIKDKLAMPRLKRYLETIKMIDKYGDILKKAKIAVVDDSNLSLFMLKKILFSQGVTNASFYNDPIAFLKDDQLYDIYIIDFILPGMSGEELVYELRKRNSKSIIMIISGINHHKTISHVLIAGADDYMVKPFDPQVFLARLRNHLKTMKMIEKIENQNKELDVLSKIDSLTEIPNRLYLMMRLDDEIKRSKRLEYPLSIILLDIDNFKLINDQCGHIEGDLVLKNVAKLTKNCIRETDFVGRYGGEEFLVILPKTTLNQALIVGNKIKNVISSHFEDNQNYNVTVSGGIAGEYDFDKDCIINGVANTENIINRADKKLYEAKRKGKNQIL